MGLKAHSHNGRLKRTLISNISSIDPCEPSERALGEIALSRLKLGARLMMRGKGDTYQKRKGACVKVQRVIIRGENEALFTTSKKRHSPGIKKVSHENRKWVFIRGEKGHL